MVINKISKSFMLLLISVILYFFIFKWIDYLVNNKYITNCSCQNIIQKQNKTYEGFDTYTNITSNYGTPKTTNNVNIPLTTQYSCTNFCGPTSRCSITGQQCSADIDCPGCQPYIKTSSYITSEIKPNDDSGKMTSALPLNYSPLTFNIENEYSTVQTNVNKKTPQPNFGINTWQNKFNQQNSLFKQRYQPPNLTFMPSYMPKYSATGIFMDEGPLASNEIIN